MPFTHLFCTNCHKIDANLSTLFDVMTSLDVMENVSIGQNTIKVAVIVDQHVYKSW